MSTDRKPLASHSSAVSVSEQPVLTLIRHTRDTDHHATTHKCVLHSVPQAPKHLTGRSSLASSVPGRLARVVGLDASAMQAVICRYGDAGLTCS
jgi:hypothetical protein